jgi:fibronectin type 3 domain-containing protein/predicted esterase
MKKVFILFLLLAIFFNYVYSQNPGNETQIGITDFELQDGTWSYRTDNNGSVTGFYDKTTWNSSPYLQGHLRQISTTKFRMNYRFLMPGGYDANYSPGYPLIVMLHGAVERGNCWQASPSSLQCYYGGKSYDPSTPVTNNFGLPFNSRNNLLNNDHQLLNGGGAHLGARDRAGTKKPNDPTLDPRAWPGFVLFPQMLDGWDSWNFSPGNYQNDIYDVIRIVRLMIKKYKINPNQVYIHGLSNGGRGVLEAVRLADWLFAAAAPMSSINSPGINTYRDDADTWSVPLWWFQGGKDGNPTPVYTESKITELKTRGANIRYTKYANLGHGVWNTAYAEPDFWSWFLSKSKSDLFVAYGTYRICSTSGAVQPFPTPTQAGARLAMPREMYQYQWKKDNVLIAPTTFQIYVTLPGQYQGRFSRVPNPTSESDWNEWSKPVDITLSAPPIPTLTNTQSIMLTDLNNVNTSQFIAPPGYFTYRWWMTTNNQSALNTVTQLDGSVYNQSTLALNLANAVPSPPGTRTSYGYRVRVQDIDGCYNPTAPNKTVWFSDGVATSNNAAVGQNAPVTNFTGSLNGPVDVLLKWNDTNWESDYEIWRATEANKNGTWSLIKIASQNSIVYLDAGLQPGTTYHYKIRAISQTATSDFVPGHKDKNITVSVTTTSDAGVPSTPQNLQAELIDTDISLKKVSVKLNWTPSTDDYAVHHYRVAYGATVVNTPDATPNFTVDGLNINANYAFTVRAVDNSNNVSGPSQQVNINTKIDGLFYIHSTSFYTDLSQVDESKWYDREFTGRVPNVDLSVATQDSYDLITFYGYLYITTPGQYKFRVHNNDGVRLKVNNQVIIYVNDYVPSGCPQTDMNQLDGNNNLITSMNLPAGYIPVEIRYWQSEDDRCLTWEWQGADAGVLTDWFTVPDERLTTEPISVPPVLPSAVSNLSIQQPYGIDELTLNWTYVGAIAPPVSFEVYRATSAAGPWTLVNLASGSPYTDPSLIPLTTYYYKLKSVSDNGTSGYSNVASAQTGDDAQAPTAPENVTVPTTTLTSALVEWEASTDDVGVVAYRIYVIPPTEPAYLAVTTTETFGVVTNLDPGTNYSFYVVAVDAKGNVSPNSNVVDAMTQGASAFFFKTGVLAVNSTNNWTSDPDGIGTSAPSSSFTIDGNYFNLYNTTSTATPQPLTAVWSVSGPSARIVIGNGVALSTSGSNSGIVGNLEILGNGKVVLATNTQPIIVAVSESSTVTYSMESSSPSTTTVAQQIQQVEYGNLELIGQGSLKVFQAGTTVIHGDLTVGNLVAISGAPGNGSTIILYGDLIYADGATPLFTSSDNAVILEVRKPDSQQIKFSGQLNIHEIKVSVPTAIDINSDGGVAVLNLGSSSGGGLSLPTGSSLKISTNQSLRVSGAGTINSNGETGSIIANGGSIEIATTNTSASNLYIDQTANKQLTRLSFDSPGGQLRVWNPLNVTDGLKVISGSLYSNGNITLKSNASKTANLEEMGEFGQVVGDVSVERFVHAKQNTYRYLSASVAGVKVVNWQAFFPISGNFTGRNLNTSPSLFVQGINPSTSMVEWRGYPQTSAIKTNQAPIERAIGYAAYIRNDVDFTMSLKGVPFQGSIPFNSLIAPYTVGAYTFDGWNLIGNPYASTIQWSLSEEAWSNRNAISNIVAVRENVNATSGHFLYYDAFTQLGTSTGDDNGLGGTLTAGKIAPGQAFYVQTTGANPSLTINESAKYVDQQDFFRKSADSEVSHLYINLKKGQLMDQAIVVFTEFGSDDYEAQFDAIKLSNEGMFNFSTLTTNGRNTAINNMSNSFCDKSIALNIENVEEGDYTIEFPAIETLMGIGSIQLLDKFLDKTITLGDSKEYSFTVTSDQASFGRNRFEIVMNRPNLDMDLSAIASEDCGEIGKITLSNAQRGASYSVIDSEGNVVGEKQICSEGTVTFNIPVSSFKEGVNLLTIEAGFEGCGFQRLSQQVEVEYYTPPMMTVNDLSTCSGSSVTARVSESPSIVSYNWYNAAGIKVKGFTSNFMETPPVFEETVFTVAAVLKNGCEGPRQGFVVYPVDLAEPELILQNDTLFTAVDAEEFQWSLNGEIISVTNNRFLTALTPGVYSVTCKNGGCSKTSKEFAITGNDDVDVALQYSLYPNPASSDNVNLKVITANREEILVKVIDVLGKEHYVNSFTVEELRNSVKISPRNEFRAGVYYLLLKQKSIFKEIKFIIRD